MKETEIRNCPYHDCQPSYKMYTVVENRIYDHFFYCPKCKEETNGSNLRGKYDKFSYGAWSQNGKSNALRNWNNKVKRHILNMMIEDVRNGR